MSKPRLFCVDDHLLILDGLVGLLRDDFELAGTASEGRSAVEAILEIKPDLVLLDIALPLLNGIETARQIKHSQPDMRILFVTMQTDKHYVLEAFRAGGTGYVLKQAASGELLLAIRSVLDGNVYVSPLITEKTGISAANIGANPGQLFGGKLTPRQREVLQLVAEGKSQKETAEILKISVRTVEFHKASIMEELGLRTTAELTRYALSQGIAGA